MNMNEQQIKDIMNQYLPVLKDDSRGFDERALLSLCKEIERETRHAAMALAYKLAAEINNLKDKAL